MIGLGRRLLVAASWQVGGNVVRLGLGLVASTLFVRWLGTTEYGRASWFLSLTLYLSILVSAGLGTPLTRRLTRHLEADDGPGAAALLGRIMVLRVLSLAPAGLVLLLASPWLPADTGPRLYLLVTFALLAVSFPHAAVLQTLRVAYRHDVVAKLTTVEIALKLGLVWWLGGDQPTAGTLLGAGIAAEVASTLVAAVVVTRHLRRRPAGGEVVPRAGLRTLVREGRATWLLSLAHRILGRDVDVLIIGLAAAPAEVTRYALSFTVANLAISLTTSAIQGTTNLAAFTEVSRDPAGARRLRRALAEFWLLLIVPAAVGGALVGPRLMDLLYGEAAAGTAAVCGVLFAALALLELAAIGKDALLGAGRDRHAALVNGVGGVVNLVLTLVLVGRWGALGAAVATLIAAAVTVTLTFARRPRTTLMTLPWRPVVVCGLGLLAMAGSVQVADGVTGSEVLGLLLAVSAGGLAYLATLILLQPRTSLRPAVAGLGGAANLLRVFL